jgi:DnaK suppressor protein
MNATLTRTAAQAPKAAKATGKTAKSAGDSAAKSSKSTAKSTVQSAAKSTVAKKAKGAPEANAVEAKTADKASASKPDSRETSGASMSGDNASTGLTDTMENPVVSKASEVATQKKSTPAAATDGELLTEAQILQMSDKDYMNEAQLAFFKARLQQLERDLLKNADETTEHLRETVLVPDPADRATIEEEHALELRTRDRERKLLKKVQQAIASIDTGDYGWCEETGEPIGIPRLLARPTATLSLEAQQRRELKQKLYGD